MFRRWRRAIEFGQLGREIAIGAACLANRFVLLAKTALNPVLLWPFRDVLQPLLLDRRQPIIRLFRNPTAPRNVAGVT